jgi:hypothetical protein
MNASYFQSQTDTREKMNMYSRRGNKTILCGIYWSVLLLTCVRILQKNMETLIDASKEVGLEVNTENKVYVAVSSPECRAKSRHKNS